MTSVAMQSPTADPGLLALLERLDLFRGLPPAELCAAVRAAGYRTLARGAVLFREGDPADALYVLTQGRVKVTQLTVDGVEILLRFVGPGELFGCVAALGERVYPGTAVAVEPGMVLRWESKVIAALLESCPHLSQNVLRLLTGRVLELQARLRELFTERVERRIARALLRLACQAGREAEDGVLIDLPLSRQSLASLTGTTLYTASRILSRWEQQGLIASGRARILLRSLHGLTAIAEDQSLDH
jgi:CRP-like cAMP-binding protein